MHTFVPNNATRTCPCPGYGDYHPISEHERVFTAFFIIFGIVVCSSALGVISTMMQAHQERVNKLRGMRAMLLMKEEEEAAEERARSFAANDMTGNISLSALRSAAQTELTADEESPVVSPVYTNAAAEPHSGHEEDEDGGDRKRSVSSISPKRRMSRGFLDMAMSLSIERPRKKTLKELRDASLSAFEEDYYQMMIASIVDFVAIFVILIVGMIGMHIVEGWSYGEAFYWATVTIMTVGYGDLTPTTDRGKVFTIFYCLIGCAFMAKVLTDFIRYPLLARMVRNEEEVAKQFTGVSNSPELLENIFDNELHKLVPDLKRNADEMTKCEFVLVVLHLMNKLEEKDVFLAAKLFDDMDLDMKGFFSRQDMHEKVTEAASRQQASRINIDDVNNARGSFTSSIRGTIGSITRKFSDGGPDFGGSPRAARSKKLATGSGATTSDTPLSASWGGSSMRAALLDPSAGGKNSAAAGPSSSASRHVSSSYGGTASASLYVPPPLPAASHRPFQGQSAGSAASSTTLPSAATPVSSTAGPSALSKLFAAERKVDDDAASDA